MVNRRALFAAAGGSAAAFMRLAGTEAAEPAPSTGPARTSPVVPRDAPADGESHPASERFRSLAETQSTYPAARSLSDELDWCALQSAIDAAEAQGSGAVYVPNRGRPYVLNRTLRLNPNRVTVRGDGSALDFRPLRDAECALLFRADGAPPYGHERHVFEGFELIGPGRDRLIGALFKTETNGLSSRAQLRDCTIRDFFVGIQFGDRAYGIGFEHVSVYACEFAVHVPYGLHDAGETISFSQCYLFNSGCLVSNGGAFDLKFFGCSLDYAKRFIWDNNGGIDLVGCRLEMAPPIDPAIHCNGGRVNIFGGFILINGTHDNVRAPELFALSNPGASLHLFSVMGWNWRTTTGKLTNGPGKIRWYTGEEITRAPPEIGSP